MRYGTFLKRTKGKKLIRYCNNDEFDESIGDEIFWWFFWRTNKSTLEKMKTYKYKDIEWEKEVSKKYLDWRNELISEDTDEREERVGSSGLGSVVIFEGLE